MTQQQQPPQPQHQQHQHHQHPQEGSAGTSSERPEWGGGRSRVITWFDPHLTARAGATLSGLEFIRAIQSGVLAPPPIASVFGFAVTEVEVGRVTIECTPDESAYNPIGIVHGGLVCTLADSVVGCAVHTTLEAGVTGGRHFDEAGTPGGLRRGQDHRRRRQDRGHGHLQLSRAGRADRLVTPRNQPPP